MGKNSKRRPKWAITNPRHKQGLTARARRVKMEVKMPDDGDEMVEVEVKVEHSTGKAWLVIDTMTNNQGWAPKSRCHIVRDVDPDGNTILAVPKWWARQRKFIE
jgi:hypothetical protein